MDKSPATSHELIAQRQTELDILAFESLPLPSAHGFESPIIGQHTRACLISSSSAFSTPIVLYSLLFYKFHMLVAIVGTAGDLLSLGGCVNQVADAVVPQVVPVLLVLTFLGVTSMLVAVS